MKVLKRTFRVRKSAEALILAALDKESLSVVAIGSQNFRARLHRLSRPVLPIANEKAVRIYMQPSEYKLYNNTAEF